MEKLNVVYFSSISNKKVYDEFDDCIGKLKDIYVTTEDGYPRAIGYKIKRGSETFNYEFKTIEFVELDNGDVAIHAKGGREILPRTYSYLLSKHLIGKEIVDINGKKVIRVNDLRLAFVAGELKVVAVDQGPLALGRKLGFAPFMKWLYKITGKRDLESMVMWEDVESLEMVDNNLKLQIPFQKLSKLHPADLADILEEMDAKYRAKIFESLDENLAAETLEEIEPKVQADIIQALSESKTSEVLLNMSNDEIVDLIEEVDEETKEKILTHLEEEDSREIEELMTYQDETVGALMSKEFISFNIDVTVAETIDILKEMKPDEEMTYYIFIVDDEEKLQGFLTLKDLIMNEPDAKLDDIMEKDITTIKVDDDIEDTIEISTKYDLLSIPVVDKSDKLCGVVILHDIVDEFLVPMWHKKFKRVG